MRSRFLSVLALTLSFSVFGIPTKDDAKKINEEIFKAFKGAIRKGPKGQTQRPVFAKDHGCVKATFKVVLKKGDKYRIGPFARDFYDSVWIRWANDSDDDFDNPPDENGRAGDEIRHTVGMAIKLIGYEQGPKLLPGRETAITQDFLMQNHPVFFSKNSKDFLALIKGTPPAYTNEILAEMDKNLLANPLFGQYWTALPYRLGKDYIKYMAKPCSKKPCEGPVPVPDPNEMKGRNFRRENVAKSMATTEEPFCFDFCVQVRTKPKLEPLDDATARWTSPWIKFGEIRIASHQDINAQKRMDRCESLAFTGWNTDITMEPVGSLNETRKIYPLTAEIRRQENGVSLEEPTVIKDDE